MVLIRLRGKRLTAVCLTLGGLIGSIYAADTAGPNGRGDKYSDKRIEPVTPRKDSPLGRFHPPTPEQDKEIREQIEKLVLEDGTVQECRRAFARLYEFGELAIPALVEHRKDDRKSTFFRNHRLDGLVGDACGWNLYYQLQDRPEDYSRYGYQRKGKDGKSHVQPYWKGTPFDEAGGVKEWLEKHCELTYPEMQVKCLQWLLAKEREIGCPDAESYFRDVLPLEVQIKVRELQAGKDVEEELKRLRQILQEKKTDQVPPELLPSK